MAARGGAQQAVGFRRIGVLMSLAHDDRQGRRYIAAFLDRLQELGWKDGPGLAIDVRRGAADLDHIRSYASELAAVKPNVILAQSALALTPISSGALGNIRTQTLRAFAQEDMKTILGKMVKS